MRDIALATEPGSWILVGGLTTQVHAGLAGYASRATKDVDLLVDLMASSANVSKVTKGLESLGFQYKEPGLRGSPFHRMVKDGRIADILVADHLPRGKKSRATVNRWPVMEAPGGAQAIARSVEVNIAYGDEPFGILIPNLLGAIVLKCAACASDTRDKYRHLEDIALLASLIDDLKGMREDMHGSDRKRIKAAWQQLQEANEPAWLILPESLRVKGQDALRILLA